MLAVILLFTMVAGLMPAIQISAASDTSAVGEAMDSFAANGMTFTITEDSRIFVIADTEPTGDLLQTVQLIQRQFAADQRPSGTPIPIAWGPEAWAMDGDIVIHLDAAAEIPAEGYKLDITTVAKITVSDVDGLIYGANMVLKHLRYAEGNSIQGFTATNAPDTKQRAVSLDCGRKYYTKDWICNFIREMSWMGYNTLEMHFSDDSGFRIDLWDEAYYTENYQPVNDFSWICGSNYTSWTLSAYQNDPDKGKYLTTAEVIEILNTAKEYHIDVIPAFDSPSHMDYLTWTYEQNYLKNPDYSFYSTYTDKTYYAKDVGGCINYTNSSGWSTPLRWPYYSTIDVTAEHDKAFIFELYIDIANFFKAYSSSTDFSIGADEVNLNTANLASGYKFAWSFPDFVVYINELNTLLNGMGYTMRMYNDFMGNVGYNASSYDFADNIEILYWDSPFNPATGKTDTTYTQPVSYFVSEGRTIYNCIQTNTYYALRCTSDGSDARSVNNRMWTFYHANEEDIFDEWYPADISEHGDYSEDVADVPQANLGGAYFLIWGDYACVSTEQEIWNGVSDKKTGEWYSLRDRMWSNISKMWNWDLNSSMTFTQFQTLRDAYGDFPGAGTKSTSCSEKTILPAATEPVSGYAGGCTVYAAYGEIQIVNGTSVMNLPCTSAVEETSAVVESAGEGTVFIATRLFKNTEGELWYKVKTQNGLLGYVKATDTRYLTDLVDDITITGATKPTGHVAGSSFTVAGDIVSLHNNLAQVSVSVYSGFSDGEAVIGSSDAAAGNSYSLNNSAIDNSMAFGKVPLGEHTYVVSVQYESYHADGNNLVSGGGNLKLIDEYFMVISKAGNASTCVHTYNETVMDKANCSHDGVSVYACTTCGHVYEAVVEDGGHEYDSESIGATCSDYEKVRYTCSICGYSYVTYPDHLLSQWQDSLPDDVDMRLVETKTVYRYADRETLTSYESTVDGYSQVGSQWQTKSTGSVQYVNTWPSGFNTSNSLYAKYNNKSQKVSAFEDETSKRVINSDKVSGYLYYHWCFAKSYYSVSYKTGSYTTFHAYYSTTAPSNYVCDTSDYSYKTAHSTCSNSNWFFVANVYTQSYTDYEKLYTHERWTDWSEWRETPIEATDDRKVEVGTLYRFVDGTLEPHVWDAEGVCTQCGANCPHSYQNNICTDCGLPKPVFDYYLFGWINGQNYACEENAGELGAYKFVDGQLVLMFSQDSYVGIKASDNATYYMTDGWQGFVSSATLYNTAKLKTADKLFVPGGTEVTFTLEDNGDDTYVLSYVAVKCDHISHTVDATCTICGSVVEHSYGADGFCICGLECQHSMADGFCSNCGMECDHAYQNNICTICGLAKPVMDYYLFGYINGANYGCEEDYMNLGEHKFVDGVVVVKFTTDSYVAVKGADNAHWYMTEGWLGQVTSATLYNTKKLTQADKLYVPAGKLVTFTLVDNGDDTYLLSYEAVCAHNTHSQDGICDDCDEKVLHTYQNNVCTLCGYEKPDLDYYLFGYINGADYADKADKDNLGIYKFVDGSLVVYFTVNSYVGVKSSDNLSWYMTDGYQEGKTSVTLVNADSILTEDKLFVPANMKVTFTLVDNGDDTYQFCYEAVTCPHEVHNTNGICNLCKQTVKHNYVEGVCECGATCSHNFYHGACTICSVPCVHSWDEGVCTVCQLSCQHSWIEGVCQICSFHCGHNWIDGECSVCGVICVHRWSDGHCAICAYACKHTYQNNICTICDFPKPAVDYYLFGNINGQDYAWGENADQLGEYKFVDGKLVVTFRQESRIGLKASNNAGWYMTAGNQGSATNVMLYNTAAITNGALLTVPGCMEITFTLVDNGDDTLTLSYVAVACDHTEHNDEGECTKCGTIVNHNYKSVVIAPTCTVGGYTTHTCTVCGISYMDAEVDALGHSWVDATCTESQFCSVCGRITGKPLGHRYEDVVVAPTCTSNGYTMHTCKVCGGVYVDSPVNATGHNWSGATCTEPMTCKTCGATYGEAQGHSYQSETTAPTCTDKGYTLHTCLSCGISYKDNEVQALGHIWGEATCTEAMTCTVCGDTSGDMLGHKYDSVTKEANCTEDGYTTHICSVCGDTYVDGKVSAWGHSWIDATCTEAKYCSTCGEIFGEALGHNYKATITNPTCTEKGYTTHICSTCGDSYVDGYTDAIGHNWVKGVCSNCSLICEHSYQDGTCAQCGKKEPMVKLSYPSLSFEDEILYNVYYTLQDIDLADVAEMGLVTFGSRLTEGTIENAVNVYSGYITGGSVYMAQTEGIPAKNMADTVYFKVYAQMNDGSYIYSQIAGYNAVAYANTVLNKSTSTNQAKALVVAMLNYGAAAQQYFDYNTDSLMNEALTAEQQALVESYNEAMVADVVPADKSKVGSFVMDGGYSDIYPTVSFNGAFSINYYFANTRTPDNGLTFYYWDSDTYASVDVLTAENATGTIQMVRDGKYWFAAVEGIAAKDMDKTVYVAAVYTTNGLPFATNVIAYSLGRYCETIASNGDAFGAATAVYGYYAANYFANN